MTFFQKKLAFRLSLLAVQVCCLAPARAMTDMSTNAEKIILDKTGKIVVPYCNADNISYVGGGVYLIRFRNAAAPVLYDTHGNKIFYHLPNGSSFGSAFIEPVPWKNSDPPTRNILISFGIDGKEGLCDLAGKILMPAKYLSLIYLGNNVVIAHGENFQDELIVKLDGTVVAELKHNGDSQDVRASMMGGATFSEGRRSVDHGFASPCALMDLSGKVITDYKFLMIGNFENGIASARIPLDGGAISVFIDRQGNIVKKFPKGFDVNWSSFHSRYSFTSGISPALQEGLIDQKGDVVIPAEYDTLSCFNYEYYLGRHRGEDDALDVYDLNGKLLSHYPHEVKRSTLKQPENSLDKSLNLTTLQDFLAKHDGAAVADLSNSDGSSSSGLVNQTGNWIVPPIYAEVPPMYIRQDNESPGQFVFELKIKTFSKEAWDRIGLDSTGERWSLFQFFLKEHDLIGMPIEKVKSFLGEPSPGKDMQVSYPLSKFQDSQTNILYLRLNKQNCVSAWRYIYTSNGVGHPAEWASQWESRNMTLTPEKDGTPRQLVPKYPEAILTPNLYSDQLKNQINIRPGPTARSPWISFAPKDTPIQLVQVMDGKETNFFVCSARVSEGAIRCHLLGENIQGTFPNGAWLSFPTRKNKPIFAARPLNAAMPFKITGDYDYRIGVPGGRPDLTFIYKLPFQKGCAHLVSEGYFGNTHTALSGEAFAVDFEMPEGTIICAARDGVVVAFRDDSSTGGNGEQFIGFANYVYIKHADGSYSQYAHLRHNGVIVKLGDRVKAGQIIGLSGNTGSTSGPHLHFSVTFVDDSGKSHSVPVCFSTVGGIVSDPKDGQILQNPKRTDRRKRCTKKIIRELKLPITDYRQAMQLNLHPAE